MSAAARGRPRPLVCTACRQAAAASRPWHRLDSRPRICLRFQQGVWPAGYAPPHAHCACTHVGTPGSKLRPSRSSTLLAKNLLTAFCTHFALPNLKHQSAFKLLSNLKPVHLAALRLQPPCPRRLPARHPLRPAARRLPACRVCSCAAGTAPSPAALPTHTWSATASAAAGAPRSAARRRRRGRRRRRRRPTARRPHRRRRPRHPAGTRRTWLATTRCSHPTTRAVPPTAARTCAFTCRPSQAPTRHRRRRPSRACMAAATPPRWMVSRGRWGRPGLAPVLLRGCSMQPCCPEWAASCTCKAPGRGGSHVMPPGASPGVQHGSLAWPGSAGHSQSVAVAVCGWLRLAGCASLWLAAARRWPAHFHPPDR